MSCCCCYENIDTNKLVCSHKICTECMLSYVKTKWCDGCYEIFCPICRNLLSFSCHISKGKPIFQYDNIYFTTSTSGSLVKVPSVRPWERQGSRLVRTAKALVLPILCLKNTKVSTHRQLQP